MSWEILCRVSSHVNQPSLFLSRQPTNTRSCSTSPSPWKPTMSVCTLHQSPTNEFKYAKLFLKWRRASWLWQTTMSRGQEQSYPGYLHLSRMQRLVVLGHVNESSEYARVPLPSVPSIGLELLILKGATLKFRLPMVLMVEHPACLGELVHSGPRFCKVLFSWMDSRLKDGVNINSMQMMTTLSRDGLSQTNGRLGFNTIESARLRRPWRIILNTCINARGGLAAIGEVTIPA